MTYVMSLVTCDVYFTKLELYIYIWPHSPGKKLQLNETNQDYVLQCITYSFTSFISNVSRLYKSSHKKMKICWQRFCDKYLTKFGFNECSYGTRWKHTVSPRLYTIPPTWTWLTPAECIIYKSYFKCFLHLTYISLITYLLTYPLTTTHLDFKVYLFYTQDILHGSRFYRVIIKYII